MEAIFGNIVAIVFIMVMVVFTIETVYNNIKEEERNK
jgi:hypothetical protein